MPKARKTRAADKTLSISDRLTALGYGHRRDANTVNTGRREVFQIKTGKIVGKFNAHEAAEHFLAA